MKAVVEKLGVKEPRNGFYLGRVFKVVERMENGAWIEVPFKGEDLYVDYVDSVFIGGEGSRWRIYDDSLIKTKWMARVKSTGEGTIHNVGETFEITDVKDSEDPEKYGRSFIIKDGVQRYEKKSNVLGGGAWELYECIIPDPPRIPKSTKSTGPVTIQNLQDLKNRGTLKLNDIVWFDDLEYEVHRDFLNTMGNNSEIFKRLGLDNKEFTSKHYGYGPYAGDWPCSKLKDYEALTRVVEALYKEMDKQPLATMSLITTTSAKVVEYYRGFEIIYVFDYDYVHLKKSGKYLNRLTDATTSYKLSSIKGCWENDPDQYKAHIDAYWEQETDSIQSMCTTYRGFEIVKTLSSSVIKLDSWYLWPELKLKETQHSYSGYSDEELEKFVDRYYESTTSSKKVSDVKPLIKEYRGFTITKSGKEHYVFIKMGDRYLRKDIDGGYFCGDTKTFFNPDNDKIISHIDSFYAQQKGGRVSYLEKHKASGLKIGDTVKVTREAKNQEDGWKNTWAAGMDDTVGKTFVIKDDREDAGFWLEGTDFRFPYFILEKKGKISMKLNDKIKNALKLYRLGCVAVVTVSWLPNAMVAVTPKLTWAVQHALRHTVGLTETYNLAGWQAWGITAAATTVVGGGLYALKRYWKNIA